MMSASESDERLRIAAVRFGYGPRPGEAQAGTVDALIAQLDPETPDTVRFPIEGAQARIELVKQFAAARSEIAKRKRAGVDVAVDAMQLNKRMNSRRGPDRIARLAQAVMSPHGFRERLAIFWGNHFAISATKSSTLTLLAPLFELQAIRPNMGGRFGDLLQACSLHPAMLLYLDQNQSLGPNSEAAKKSDQRKGVNENFAREVMELHTLGVHGGYDQRDVSQLALLLTGVVDHLPTVAAAFRPNRAEPGRFTVLGRTFERDAEPFGITRAALDHLAAQPQTAEHICRKLVHHFLSDDPPERVVAAMTRRWRETDGQLTEVYRAMLEAPEAFSAESVKTKMPFDYLVTVMRALDVGEGDLLGADDRRMAAEVLAGRIPTPPVKPPADGKLGRSANQGLNRMGQPIWAPRGAAGFADESSAWTGSSQLAERIAFSRRAVRLLGKTQDPRPFAQAVLGGAARPETTKIISQAPNRPLGLLLCLISPEFNRR